MATHASINELQTVLEARGAEAIEAMVRVRVWLNNQATLLLCAPYRPLAEAYVEQGNEMGRVHRLLLSGDATLLTRYAVIRKETIMLSKADRNALLAIIERFRRTHEIFAELNRDFKAHGDKLNQALFGA